MSGRFLAVGWSEMKGQDLLAGKERCRFNLKGVGSVRVEWVGFVRGYGECYLGR